MLQPPLIRHRVLSCSDKLEVIEVGSPARHETLTDRNTPLPTGELRPDRRFAGQTFVRHQAQAAPWVPWHLEGFEYRDTGIAKATAGLAQVGVVRRCAGTSDHTLAHKGDLLFWFVLAGRLTITLQGEKAERLKAGDAVVVPPSRSCVLSECSADFKCLEVALSPP